MGVEEKAKRRKYEWESIKTGGGDLHKLLWLCLEGGWIALCFACARKGGEGKGEGKRGQQRPLAMARNVEEEGKNQSFGARVLSP